MAGYEQRYIIRDGEKILQQRSITTRHTTEGVIGLPVTFHGEWEDVLVVQEDSYLELKQENEMLKSDIEKLKSLLTIEQLEEFDCYGGE
jgi:hypothetical protein